MNWIIYFVLLSFTIYLCYNFAILSLFSTPQSLSKTYYLFKERKSWQKYLFPVMMISTAMTLISAWLEISNNSPFQFCAFFGVAGIIFTGMAPAFKDDDTTKTIHTVSAITAAVFSILWIILVAKLWWVIVVWLIFVLLVSLLTQTLKSGTIYWLETIAFMSTFTSIIIHFLSI